MCRKLIYLVYAVLILIMVACIPAGAAVPIEVENPSFELPGVGKRDIDQSGTVPGWARVDLTTSAGVELGWTPTDGIYTAFLGKNAVIYNLTDFLIMEGDQFQMIFDARSTWQGNNLLGQLYYDVEGDRVVFASTTVDLTQHPSYATFTVDSNAVGPALNDYRLGIQFTHEYVPGMSPDDNIWAGIDYIELILTSLLMRAQNPFPEHESSYGSTDVTLTWIPGPNVPSVDSYHVYLSENRDDVKEGNENANKGSTTTPSFSVNDLTKGRIYYWRVDTVVGANTYRGNIWSFTIIPLIAYDPNPAKDEQFAPIESVLSWKAGTGAVQGHVVFFGEDFNVVNDAPVGTSGSPPFRAYLTDPADTDWAPEEAGLVLETDENYYWRIDEVESSSPMTIHKGEVWSFTTVPIKGLGWITRDLYENIDGLTVADLTSDPNYPDNPTSTERLPSFEAPHMAISNYGSRVHGWLYVRNSGEYTFWIASGENSQLWLGNHPSTVSMIAYVDSEDGREGWTQPREWDKYSEIQQSDPIKLEGGGNLYYIMALHKKGTGYDNLSVAWSGPDSNWLQEIIPGTSLIPFDEVTLVEAGGPNPHLGATDVSREPILTWISGKYAAVHQVYFGTNEEAVRNATTTSPEYRGIRDLGTERYAPGTLEFNTTYYWRVDEVNDVNPDSPWIGKVWSFSTGNYLVVEDFEDYNDYEPDTVWNTWLDGYDDPTNGSSAGYPEPDFFAGEHYLEDEIVHGGNWSMPLFYDNSSATLSEVTRTLNADWTQEGVITLTLWYHGDAANAAEPMYVALNGNAVVTNDDANAALVTEWTQWDIFLQLFADQGVNLANVSTMSIGFGNKANPVAGGSGHVFFDDIRLYRP